MVKLCCSSETQLNLYSLIVLCVGYGMSVHALCQCFLCTIINSDNDVQKNEGARARNNNAQESDAFLAKQQEAMAIYR